MIRRLRICQQETSTWWIVETTDGERFVVHAIDWRIGRFRSIRPIEVFVYHEMTEKESSDAQRLEQLPEREFATMIAAGRARRIV
jgi:hypothetical protein